MNNNNKHNYFYNQHSSQDVISRGFALICREYVTALNGCDINIFVR